MNDAQCFEKLFNRTEKSLKELLEELHEKSTPSFKTWPIKKEYLDSEGGALPLLKAVGNFAASGDSFLYYFSSQDMMKETEANKAVNALKRAKGAKMRNYTTYNKKKDKDSECIYVGKSLSDIRKRLKDHLGHGSKTTYSLHLNTWWPRSIPLNFTCARYSNISPLILTVLEQTLWKQEQPLFGQCGKF